MRSDDDSIAQADLLDTAPPIGNIKRSLFRGVGIAVAALAFIVLALSVAMTRGHIRLVLDGQVDTISSQKFAGIMGLEAIFLLLMAGTLLYRARRQIKDRQEDLARLRADSLPERAKHAASVLQEATTLVEELQAELTARTALLEDVKRQVAETNQRAAEMKKLSHVDEETTRILNKYFDEALKSRLETLEYGARRREWLLGTVGALAFGIIAILFAHFVLGF